MKKKSKVILFAVIIFMLTSMVLITACGKCAHDYKNGICVHCGEADPDYKAPSCTHSYVNGTCEKCGVVCTHSYINATCTKCGVTCAHDYNEGICENCGTICTHIYAQGVCTECGIACVHTYNEGVCTICQAEDPNYLPERGRPLYDEIVNKYKYLILYKYTNEELPPRGTDEPFYMDALYEAAGQYDPTKNFGYSFKDIDGDGLDELFLVENTNRLYAMFSIKNKAPIAVATFQNGKGYLKDDGTVFFNIKELNSSNDQILSENHITHLVNGALVGIAYGREDPDDDGDTDNDIYYYVSEGGTRTELAKSDYNAIADEYEYYWGYSTRLTKLSNLSFYPALIASGTPSKNADFSSYAAIIDTFGYMHSAAKENKWDRSFWIGGRYDEGMIFKTEADFVLYNKLFAAYFLVTENKSATVGYAKKDLNGDGVEELILLDGDFNIYAIFTQVDGAAVLLDSYNDLRTAFIDADGLIHVRQRIIPGYKNNEKKDGYSKFDCEAFVYEVCEGKLTEKIAIGMKFDSVGNQEMIYKIVDGASVIVDQAEWDALYAQYSADIGEATFAAYTKEKAGLGFVAVPVA